MVNKVDLEDWHRLRYRMKEEGIEYCFKHYSNWSEIDDVKFHELRTKLIETMNEIREYVDDQILNYDSGEEWPTIPPQN